MASKVLCQLILLLAALTIAPEATQQTGDAAYWLQRRREFQANTSFPLCERNLRILGGRFNVNLRTGHLPFWFDYELFKSVFNKSSADQSAQEQRLRHQVYVNTCVRALKARVMFRILAAAQDTLVEPNADQFFHERHPARLPAAAQDAEQLTLAVELRLEGLTEPLVETEPPLERALRLVRAELELVESENQLRHYLEAFREADGSALAGRLPY